MNTTNEIPTPRTDLAEYRVRLGKHTRYVVRPELARQLERELAEAQRTIDGCELNFAATHADLIDCKLALAEAWEQRDRLAEVLEACMPFLSGDACGEYMDAKQALAAVKGGAQ